MDSKKQQWGFYELHFSQARMEDYLHVTKGDHDAARALHDWNNDASAAFWEVISLTEVAVRNLISRALYRYQIRHLQSPNWALSQGSSIFLNNRKMTTALAEAQRRASQTQQTHSQQSVTDQLGFGFWCQLLTKQFLFLWPDMQRTFKGLRSSNQNDVGMLMNEIRDLRNRIGHHHQIHALNLQRKHRLILLLAHYIDPHFGEWVKAKSRVEQVLARRPQTLRPSAPKP